MQREKERGRERTYIYIIQVIFITLFNVGTSMTKQIRYPKLVKTIRTILIMVLSYHFFVKQFK